eukprot:gene52487-71588_t
MGSADAFLGMDVTINVVSAGETAVMLDRVFVYGTLMRGFDHPMSKLLSAGADFLGEASCRGRLYMVAHYPGLLHSDNADDIVFGELFRLRNVDELMA